MRVRTSWSASALALAMLLPAVSSASAFPADAVSSVVAGWTDVVHATEMVASAAPSGHVVTSIVPASDGAASAAQADGPVAAATLQRPRALVFGADGTAYLGELGKIRAISPDGIVSTVAGDGAALAPLGEHFADGIGAAARLADVHQVTLSADGGRLFFADAHNARIRVVDLATGAVSTVVGCGWTAFYGGGSDCGGRCPSSGAFPPHAPPLDQCLALPTGVLAMPDGSLYVADMGSSRILRVTDPGLASASATTVAGSANWSHGRAGYVDAIGLAARFGQPYYLARDPTTGSVLVSDQGNCAVRAIALPSHAVSTYAGRGPGACGDADGPRGSATLHSPGQLDARSDGDVIVVDQTGRVRLVTRVDGTPSGDQVSTIAGHGAVGEVDGTPLSAEFANPSGGMTSPLDGSIWIADLFGNSVRRIGIAAVPWECADAVAAGLECTW